MKIFDKIKIISPILAGLSLMIFLSFYDGYMPFQAIRSQQILMVRKSQSKELSLEEKTALYEKARNINLNNCEAHSALARRYFNLAFTKGEYFIDPGENYNKEDALAALSEFNEVIKRCPGGELEIQARYSTAQIYYLSNLPEKSINELHELISMFPEGHPNLAPLYQLLSEIYAQQGDPAQEQNALLHNLYNERNMQNILENVSRIHNLLQKNTSLHQAVSPVRPLGFGKYTTAIATADKKVKLLAITNNGVSLGYFFLNNSDWAIADYLMANDNIFGSMDIDSNGKIHGVYGAGNMVFYSEDMEDIPRKIIPININDYWWWANVVEPGASTYMSSLQMVVDDNDGAHIVWSYQTAGLAYMKIVDGAPVEPELIAPYGINSDMKVQSGKVFLVYNTSSYSADLFPSRHTQVMFQEKLNNVWLPRVQLSENNVWSGGASMEVAPDGTIHVVYIAGESVMDAKLMYIVRDREGSWSSPKIIADGEFRPWIPNKYGGKYAAATTLMADGALVVVWRAPDGEDATSVLGRKLFSGDWGIISPIATIEGNDHYESPSIVETVDLQTEVIQLIWSDNNKIIIQNWNP